MHTFPSFFGSLARRDDLHGAQFTSSLFRLVGLLLVLILGTGVMALPSHGQARFPGAPKDPAVRVRAYPFDVWGPRVGFGVGIGLVGHNLGRSQSRWLLTAAPAQHEQVATLSFASANPRRAERYVLIDTRTLHTDRDWFYGLGPFAGNQNRVTVGRSAIRGRLRIGHFFSTRKLLVQPHLTVSHHRVNEIKGPVSALDPRSQRHLEQLSRGSPSQSHLHTGLDLSFDTRNGHFRPTRGLLFQAMGTHAAPLGDSQIRYSQFEVDAYKYLPLGGTHRIVTRVSTLVTDSHGETPIPFYSLPSLDGRTVPGWARSRFVGSERLIGSVLYRFPIADAHDLVSLGGHVGVHAANVYDHMGEQFTFQLSFAEQVDASASTVPLRPAASVGLRGGLPFRDVSYFDVAIGVSPEGVSAVHFSFIRKLQDLRPDHHHSRSIW